MEWLHRSLFSLMIGPLLDNKTTAGCWVLLTLLLSSSSFYFKTNTSLQALPNLTVKALDAVKCYCFGTIKWLITIGWNKCFNWRTISRWNVKKMSKKPSREWVHAQFSCPVSISKLRRSVECHGLEQSVPLPLHLLPFTLTHTQWNTRQHGKIHVLLVDFDCFVEWTKEA